MTDNAIAPAAEPLSSAPLAAEDHLKVAIIAGGLGHERDVSLRSGRRVARTLLDHGFEVEVWDLDPTLVSRLTEWGPDVVWPLVHGADGESGALLDLLRLMGLPYVGPDGAQARLASSKPTAKALLRDAGIATPVWVTFSQSLFRQVGAKVVLEVVVEEVGLPLVVKPVKGGSALGVTVVRDAAQLPEAMVNCFAYGNEAMVEQFIEGTEVAVSVVDLGEGPRVLPIVEIRAEEGFDFDARYNAGRTEFFVPARLEDGPRGLVEAVASAVHDLFSLREVSRVDMIVDGDGQPWVLDINVAPGMTETSLFPQAAAEAGPELYAAIVRAAQDEDDDETAGPPSSPLPFAGMAPDGDPDPSVEADRIAAEILAGLTEEERAPFVIEGEEPAGEQRVTRGPDLPDTDLPACPQCGAHKTHHLVFGFAAEPGLPTTIYGGQLVPGPGPWPDLQCVVCGRRWVRGEE